ncbi:MAG: DUF58 domain-containing protein [Elusimicrobia bacterium]|nr:DUF58 domain-containing protein [Candidatus Obscuribacterium magneticum]
MFRKFIGLYRWFRANKRPFKLTTAGWIFILYTIGVGAGAINTGNNLLYLIFGIFLGLILASGVLSDGDLWGLKAELVFPEQAREGELCSVALNLTNQKRHFPSISITVQLEGTLQGRPVQLQTFVMSLSPNESTTNRFLFIPPQRGYFKVTAVKVMTRFPFGLLNKSWMMLRGEAENQGMFVYPSTLRASAPRWPVPVSGREESAVDRRGDGTAIYGMREYRAGDNPRRIHWKASAKKGMSEWSGVSGWLVREMELEQSPEIYLRFPTRDELKNWTHDRGEMFIRFVATLVSQYEVISHRIHLLVGGRPELHEIDSLSHVPTRALWEFLSVVDLFDFPNKEVSPFMRRVQNEGWRSLGGPVIDLAECYATWVHQNETPNEK